MRIDGSCHCGQISYRAEIDPGKVAICHCNDCQALSGTAFRVVVQVAEPDFTLLSGTPKTYVKTAASGNKRAQTFCADCGAPLYAASVGEEGLKLLGLRLGTVRQRAALRPRVQIWESSAMPWLADIADMAKIAGQPEPAKPKAQAKT